jgi:DNA-binding NarL/FixJ family response regulator
MKEKIKIIIVDDNPTFLEGMSTFLHNQNVYQIVACFSSGTALLEKINDYKPDLILLDIEMPGLNGIETARWLNWFRNELKLISITLYQDNVYLNQLIEAGFHGFVNKNNVYEKLLHVINSVLKNRFVFPKIRLM